MDSKRATERRDDRGDGGGPADGAPGKRSLTERLLVQRRAAPVSAETPVVPAAAVQRLDDPYGLHLAGGSDDVGAVAATGLQGSATALPHLDRIQASFGGHDVSGVRAHQGPAAAQASERIGAVAYATGNDVAFSSSPDLHTAAHEAAHVVQQRAGVHLKGGVGEDGDPYERHADEVADRVVRGESAVALLDGYARPGSAAPSSAGSGPVQRYTKKGAARISDGKDMVVVDEGVHKKAFVSAGVLDTGKQGLRDGSHIELAGGDTLDPERYGLDDKDVNSGLVAATATMKASDTETRQREGAIEVSSSMGKSAQKVMDKLAKPSFWKKKVKIDISDVDPERDIIGDEEMKAKVTATYLAIAKAEVRDFSPDNVAKVAQSKGVPTKIIYYIMNAMKEYHERVLSEYDEGGFTTPNDCGEVAKNFVRGGEIKANTGGGEGFPYHFFSMVFQDGSDRIALENAVGGNHLEQLWKQGAFDADWHWELRGANHEDHGEQEIDHGLGEDKTTPGQGFRDKQYDIRLGLQDKLKPKDEKDSKGSKDKKKL